MADRKRQTVRVKYSGYPLTGEDGMRDYDMTETVTETCVIPVTDEILELLSSDDCPDWAWDRLECAVDALAACVGIYMRHIEELEV